MMITPVFIIVAFHNLTSLVTYYLSFPVLLDPTASDMATAARYWMALSGVLHLTSS